MARGTSKSANTRAADMATTEDREGPEARGQKSAATLEEAMAEAARRVAPHSPNSQYRPARAAPLISDHPIASQLQPWAGGGLSRLKLFAASREAKRRAAASIAMPKLASGAALSALVTA